MNVQGARALRKLTLRSDQLPAWNPPFRAFYINDQDDGRLRVLPDVSIVRSGSAFLVTPDCSGRCCSLRKREPAHESSGSRVTILGGIYPGPRDFQTIPGGRGPNDRGIVRLCCPGTRPYP